MTSTSAIARANGRSILKYGTIGALVASGIALVTNAFKAKDKEEELANITYSKYGAAIDSSDYAYMVMSWGD